MHDLYALAANSVLYMRLIPDFLKHECCPRVDKRSIWTDRLACTIAIVPHSHVQVYRTAILSNDFYFEQGRLSEVDSLFPALMRPRSKNSIQGPTPRQFFATELLLISSSPLYPNQPFQWNSASLLQHREQECRRATLCCNTVNENAAMQLSLLNTANENAAVKVSLLQHRERKRRSATLS